MTPWRPHFPTVFIPFFYYFPTHFVRLEIFRLHFEPSPAALSRTHVHAVHGHFARAGEFCALCVGASRSSARRTSCVIDRFGNHSRCPGVQVRCRFNRPQARSPTLQRPAATRDILTSTRSWTSAIRRPATKSTWSRTLALAPLAPAPRAAAPALARAARGATFATAPSRARAARRR